MNTIQHTMILCKPVWNKGLTSATDSRLIGIGNGASVANRGREPWNKGLTKKTDSRIAMIASHYPLNRKLPILTEVQRQYKKEQFSGENNPNWNKDKSEFCIYKIQCKFDFNLGQYPEEFDIRKVGNMWNSLTNKKGFVRDHKLSIKEGFEKGLACGILKHPANCQLISFSDNAKKNRSSVLTKESLIGKIEQWNQKYGDSGK